MNEDHYFDHDADIGIIGRGLSLEECFIDGAKVMFALMGDLAKVHPKMFVQIEFEESDIELAFVTWLNLLIAKAQADHLLFSTFQIRRTENVWQGIAKGEIWHDDIERGIDVKGATLTLLSVKKMNGQWEARCVVDV